MFAGYQMGLVATALFPLLGPPGTSIAATLFMLPTLLLFAREWLVVTGRLGPGAGRAAVLRSRALLAHGLPVVRMALAGALVLPVAKPRLPPAALAAAA